MEYMTAKEAAQNGILPSAECRFYVRRDGFKEQCGLVIYGQYLKIHQNQKICE